MLKIGKNNINEEKYLLSKIVTFLSIVILVLIYQSSSLINNVNKKIADVEIVDKKINKYRKYNIRGTINILNGIKKIAFVAGKIKTNIGIENYIQDELLYIKNIKNREIYIANKLKIYQSNKFLKESFIGANVYKETSVNYKIPVKPYRYLIVGDSVIASGLGIQLEKILSKIKGNFVIRKGVLSTGFSRPDYYNWISEIKRLIDYYRPNIIIVMIGVNDTKYLYSEINKKFVQFNTQEFTEIYRKYLRKFILILKMNNLPVFWLENPKTPLNDLNIKLGHINKLQLIETYGVKNIIYQNLWNYYNDEDGKVKKYVTLNNGDIKSIRTNDGVHFTIHGGKGLATHIINIIEREFTSYNTDKLKNIKYVNKRLKFDYYSTILKKTIPYDVILPSPTNYDLFPGNIIIYDLKYSNIIDSPDFLPRISEVQKSIYITVGIKSEDLKIKFLTHLVKEISRNVINDIKISPPFGLSIIGYRDNNMTEFDYINITNSKLNPNISVAVKNIDEEFIKNINILNKDNKSFQKTKFILKGIKERRLNKKIIKNNVLWQTLATNILKYNNVSRKQLIHSSFLDAVYNNFPEMVREYLKLDIDINTKDFEGWSALMKASNRGYLEIVKILLDKNAAINIRERIGRTPIMAAVWNGHLEVVKYLVDNGGNINAKDERGETPLHKAAKYNKIKIMKFLLKNDSKINGGDYRNRIPLVHAIQFAKYKTVKYLIENGSDINFMDVSGHTPIMFAVQRSNLKIFTLIVKQKVNLNQKNHSGITPLMQIVKDNKIKFLKKILSRKPKVNIKDKNGNSAIVHAIINKNKIAIKILIDKIDNINEINKKGESLLIHSIKTNNPTIVKIILAGKPDRNIKDKFGNSANSYAEKLNNIEILKMLKNDGPIRFEKNTEKNNKILKIIKLAA